jgi:hypothetical protein
MQQGHKASDCPGAIGIQQAQLAAQAHLVAQAGNYQNFQALPREEAAKNWSNKEPAGQSKAPKVSEVRWIQVGDQQNCWKINTRSTVYERNEDKESSSEEDAKEKDLEENLESSQRKLERRQNLERFQLLEQLQDPET